LPATPVRGALLVCHGAGSRKESHAIMGEQAAAAGLASLVFDLRGHGESEGAMDDGAIHDVPAAAAALHAAAEPPWMAARGSSLGAYWLLHAAHAEPDAFRSLVLLCPADERSLLAGLDRFAGRDGATRAAPQTPTTLDTPAGPPGAPPGADAGSPPPRFDVPRLRALWQSTDIFRSAAGLGGVLLAHARDDEDVPFSVSERLLAVLSPPRRLIALASGGHKAAQRSPLVARTTIAWVLDQGR
ncbi:MAG: alpha/beta fold hydrolase, partial [Actinobacteria bacterium]|nr:alpha/beta fold hydrolase [Actinomycetota bacterium]